MYNKKMPAKKRKTQQKSEVVETGLLVIKPVVTRRRLVFPLKEVVFLLFITSVFFAAVLVYKKASPLLKNRFFSRYDAASRLDPYLFVSNTKDRMSHVIVDTRDKESYRKGHIKWAIPADQLKVDGKRKIILYGYTQFDNKPIELASELARKGADVQVLAVGWNEFRHFSNLWVPEKDWNNFQIADFVEESL